MKKQMKNTMKKNTLFSFGLALACISASGAQAAQTDDPCAATVRVVPSHLSCQDKSVKYGIQIETMMSPITAECPYEKHVEIQTATVQVYDQNNHAVATLKINPDFFRYELGRPGTDSGHFSSDSLGIDLRNCVTPAHGGLSAGN